MGKTHVQEMEELMLRRFEGEQGKRIADRIEKEYRSLCETWDPSMEPMLRHNHNNIFPVVATMQALLAEGMDRAEACKLAGDSFLELMEQPAGLLRKLLKVPGLYRTMPWIWKTMMPKLFSPDSGFVFSFYPTDRKRVKFDMQQCPYYAVCRKLDCLDLAPIFCASDDICYGHMHPKLIWNRTKTIARGGDCCDFDVIVKSK